MKVYDNSALELLSDIFKQSMDKYGVQREYSVSLTQDAYAFNDMVGYHYLFTFHVKRHDLGGGRYLKGRKFQMVTNSSYMPDDVNNGAEWLEYLKYIEIV